MTFDLNMIRFLGLIHRLKGHLVRYILGDFHHILNCITKVTANEVATGNEIFDEYLNIWLAITQKPYNV